jgi:hypothetical protein
MLSAIDRRRDGGGDGLALTGATAAAVTAPQ